VARFAAGVQVGAAVPVEVTAELPVHLDDSIIEIDVFPTQARRLALPQPQR
jgi:hypothetical protein